MSLILAEKLSYTFPNGSKPAVSDISFTAEAGERIALIGHNASGKSTLLMLIAGLLLPSKGKLTIADMELSRKTQTAIRKKTGILFSQVEYQFIMPDCLNDTMLSIREGTPEERKDRAMQLLEKVMIADEAEQNPLALSSGQMKRAALASVLAKDPSLLLLDEPLANLDKPSSDSVIEILQSLSIAIIFATHARLALESLANRVMVLEGGNIIYDGSPKTRQATQFCRHILL